MKAIVFKSSILAKPDTDTSSFTQEKNKSSHSDLPKISSSHHRYNINYRNIEEAILGIDLKITGNRKQLDLLQHRLKCRKQYFIELLEKFHQLKSKKEQHFSNFGEKPSETLEEFKNRKVIYH